MWGYCSSCQPLGVMDRKGASSGEGQTQTPSTNKGWEQREVTAARSMGEKWRERQRRKVVRLPSLAWNKVTPHGF